MCYSETSCDKIYSHFKPIKFILGSKSFNMKPETYLMDGGIIDETLDGQCVLGLQKLPEILTNVPMILLGDVFIRHFYSVFDIDKQQVSLGVKANKQNLVSITEAGTAQTPVKIKRTSSVQDHS